ncbi:N-acetyllactosaminide beta-1,3-N-acetylglucosaminyltransferase 2-like [Patiria miniata]|uniref:Hexosyltransferase n=1 Tax=Patiria miniata TaxID=46514 RepID=A0A913ZLZ8_PATMI|nr:N-acetyllactosaminide beta-1,3-N-acetylglucosaminyltransferase 2-like [Patiria miniata]
MRLYTRRNRTLCLAFGVLCICFIIVNFIGRTDDKNVLKSDSDTLDRGEEDVRLRNVNTPIRTASSSSAAMRPNSDAQNANHTRKSNNVELNRYANKFKNSKNGTSKSDVIPAVFGNGSQVKPELLLNKSHLENKHEVKPAKHILADEDNEQTARRLQLQKENPMFSDRVINPHPFTFINNSGNCSQHAPDGKVFLLILVACRPEEVRDRRWIRDTWGSVKAYRDKVLITRFLVGQAPRKIYTRKIIWEESALYGDIIQENFADSYHNMTHKVLMGLKWAGQMCPRATYVMNLDSDMFVNVFRLVRLLETTPRRNFAIGRLKGPTLPQRIRRKKISTKWFTPVEMYPESTFPPYLNGPAYVMSGDLPGRIFSESAHVRYLPWDDVYIGMVMKKLGVRMVYGDHFEEYPVRWNGVDVLNSILNGIASYVGHQRAYNFVLRDIWGTVMKQYDNYVFSPPPDSLLRLNNASLRHW